MMKGIGILVAEWVVTGMIVYAGLCGRKLFFIDGPRSAVIMLGLIGFTMCMVMMVDEKPVRCNFTRYGLISVTGSLLL